MSVLIKGMEMPKNCGECHFCHTENFPQWCCLTEETISAIDAKHFMCPLTQLEPCEDTISRQDTIHAISDWIYDTTDERLPETVIRSLSAVQPEPHWISCSERLPEKNCRCLTTNEAWGLFEVDWNAWIDGQWLYPNKKPIAWMPMPEPYRGGEKDDR